MWKNFLLTLCTLALVSLTTGEALAQRNRTRTGTNGGTATSTGQVQNNGGGSYSNSGHKSWTGPNLVLKWSQHGPNMGPILA